jgi:hypothetical protein
MHPSFRSLRLPNYPEYALLVINRTSFPTSLFLHLNHPPNPVSIIQSFHTQNWVRRVRVVHTLYSIPNQFTANVIYTISHSLDALRPSILFAPLE